MSATETVKITTARSLRQRLPAEHRPKKSAKTFVLPDGSQYVMPKIPLTTSLQDVVSTMAECAECDWSEVTELPYINPKTGKIAKTRDACKDTGHAASAITARQLQDAGIHVTSSHADLVADPKPEGGEKKGK